MRGLAGALLLAAVFSIGYIPLLVVLPVAFPEWSPVQIRLTAVVGGHIFLAYLFLR